MSTIIIIIMITTFVFILALIYASIKFISIYTNTHALLSRAHGLWLSFFDLRVWPVGCAWHGDWTTRYAGDEDETGRSRRL